MLNSGANQANPFGLGSKLVISNISISTVTISQFCLNFVQRVDILFWNDWLAQEMLVL